MQFKAVRYAPACPCGDASEAHLSSCQNYIVSALFSKQNLLWFSLFYCTCRCFCGLYVVTVCVCVEQQGGDTCFYEQVCPCSSTVL